MTSHKERLEAATRKDFSLSSNYRNSQTNSHMSNHEKKVRNSTFRRSHSDHSEYQEPTSAGYLNMHSEKVTFADNGTRKSQCSSDKKPLYSSQPRINTNNTSSGYLVMNNPRNISNQLIYKSQSLNALKSKEPSRTLLKSSIQQEYHDQKIQRHIKKISEGQSRRPCILATLMFTCFGTIFIAGLTLICFTYIYKNINFSLDKGEMIGPVLMAGSFIFLGVGVKLLFDAYQISRKEIKSIAYEGYDRRYVGLKSCKGTLISNDKLVSGKDTYIGLTRIPNRKKTPSNKRNTLGRSNDYLSRNTNRTLNT